MDRDKEREESYYDEEDGAYAVHQLITEAYQSGVIDRLEIELDEETENE